MATSHLIAVSLARAFVAGAMDVDALCDRGASLLGRRPQWLRRLAERCTRRFSSRRRPHLTTMTQVILSDSGFVKAFGEGSHKLPGSLVIRSEMIRSGNLGLPWNVPLLRTVGELADWLQLTVRELEWFTDNRHWESRADCEKLRHYRYQWVGSGAGRVRLIEAPKPRLKGIQRKLLHAILSGIPPHPDTHGFRPGRSIRSYVADHCGQTVLFKMDLRNFFPSITVSRIVGLFMLAGYPQAVAYQLAGLSCNTPPLAVLEACPLPGIWGHEARELYRQPHLPQGAPTSPYLANLCAYRLDCRLAGLAMSAGAIYTRYADDLLFSGGIEFLKGIKRFHVYAASIILEEGFQVNTRKTRCMRRGVRQHAAGIVLNEHPNIRRDELDTLKAILHNCRRFGATSQNRAEHPDFRALVGSYWIRGNDQPTTGSETSRNLPGH